MSVRRLLRSVPHLAALLFACQTLACQAPRREFAPTLGESCNSAASTCTAALTASASHASGASAQASEPSATADAIPTVGATSHVSQTLETSGPNVSAEPDSGMPAASGAPSASSSGASESPSAADAGGALDAAPDSDTGASRCEQNLLHNPGFEQGSEDWNPSSTFEGLEVIVDDQQATLTDIGVTAVSGSHVAWLGGIPDNEFDSHLVTIEQQVDIPAEATQLVFSGHVWISTDEPSPMESYDGLYVDMLTNDADEQLLWLPHLWTSVDATGGWLAFEYVSDVIDFAGSTILLRIHSQTDPMGTTHFWFDDLGLQAQCQRR